MTTTPYQLTDHHLLAFVRVSTLRHPVKGLPVLAAFSRVYPQGWDSVEGSEAFFKLGQVLEALVPARLPFQPTWLHAVQGFDRLHGAHVGEWVELVLRQYESAHPTCLHWARVADFELAYR